MITSIICTTPFGGTTTLSLDPTQSPYIVKNIDGLGPVSANIARTSYVTKDGSIFQNARTGDRNIVLTLGLNADYSTTDDPYGELRRGLYPVFYPQSEVKLVIASTSMETVEITGWVESLEPTIFSKDPDVSISIICPDPYFVSQVDVVDTRNGAGQLIIDNPGNVETGLTILVDVFTTPSVPLEIQRLGVSPMSMYYRGGMYAQGSPLSLWFNTRQGLKSAKMGFPASGTSYSNILNTFVGNDVLGNVDNWLTVLPGQNTFNLVDAGFVGYTLHFSTAFRPKYLGM